MSEFPLFTAIYRGTTFFLRQRMVQIGLLTIAELLPAMVIPPLGFLLWVHSTAEAAVLIAWLRPWVYSQAALVSFLCVALPGRWHWRVGLALLAMLWIWGATVMGMRLSAWSIEWVAATTKSLLGELFWVFATSAAVASLVVSIAGLEIRPVAARRAERPLGASQFSLGALVATAFAVSLSLAAGRSAIGLSLSNREFRELMGLDARLVPQLAIWAGGASIGMIAAIVSRRPWLCLAIVLALTLAADYAFQSLFSSGWQGPSWVLAMAVVGRESRLWWPALIIVGHASVIARLLPLWGFEAHSPAARAFAR